MLEEGTNELPSLGQARNAVGRDLAQKLEDFCTTGILLQGFAFALQRQALAFFALRGPTLASACAVTFFARALATIWTFSLVRGEGRKGGQTYIHLRRVLKALNEGIQRGISAFDDLDVTAALLGNELPKLTIGVECLADADIAVVGGRLAGDSIKQVRMPLFLGNERHETHLVVCKSTPSKGFTELELAPSLTLQIGVTFGDLQSTLGIKGHLLHRLIVRDFLGSGWALVWGQVSDGATVDHGLQLVD